jgi:hypothetical protein
MGDFGGFHVGVMRFTFHNPFSRNYREKALIVQPYLKTDSLAVLKSSGKKLFLSLSSRLNLAL